MGEALNPFIGMVKEIAAPLKALEGIKSPLAEVQDLLATGSALGSTISTIQQAGSMTNLASLYDSVSTIQTLSKNALVRFDSAELRKIAKESTKTAEAISGIIDFDQSNTHLFDYYKDMSDLAVVSKSLGEVCRNLSSNKANEKTLWPLIKNWFSDIKARARHVIERLKDILGTIGEKLTTALEDLEKTIEGAIETFADKLRSFSETVHEFALNIVSKMFRFVEEIQKLAQANKWNIREISVEMPSCEVEVFTVAGFPIPVPKISTPGLTIAFTPMSQ